jgi:predicted transcriptional regulator
MQTTEPAVDIKALLMNQIEHTPGIRYRELLRLTGLVNGVLTYHLAGLEKANVIKVDRGSRITRYYPTNVSEKESAILKFIRHEPIRQIVLFILEQDMSTFNEIVNHTGKAPSTVSSHLKRLKEAGIISVRYGEYQIYRIVERDFVAEVLSKYKESFVDKVVDNYIQMVEEL